MFAIEKDGSILVIDAGLSFPSEEMLGIDLVLPDFTYLSERAADVLAVVLTHGHEDHVGALSWFLRDVPVPVYGTPLTLGLARRRLDEFNVKADMHEISAPGKLELGPFRCHFIAVSHSIPDALAIAVDTSDGRLLYTGDFKLDDSPIDGRHTDLETIAKLGAEGVDLLLSDSTNVDEPGRTGSEALVGDKLDEIFRTATRSIIVACFASNLHRIQQVIAAAESVGRHVAFVGRSMIANAEVGQELGHLKVSPGTIVDIGEAEHLPPNKVAIISTGSQGEPLSALSLIAAGEHKTVKVSKGDTVILSASPIPGNESSVHRVINGLYRAGARVFHGEEDGVHVSGHASSDELREMLSTVRPRHFIPVHGEFRMLSIHSDMAREVGVDPNRIMLCEDGDTIELSTGKVKRGDKVRSGTILVDGLGVGDVGPVVLRDRKILSGDGIVICIVTIDHRTGEILAGPDIISRGFVFEDEAQDFLNNAEDRVEAALKGMEHDRITDWQAIKKAMRRALGEYVWQETRRRPMIMPIVTEV
ncbi:MAG: ribonuclease [Actinomycetota bacterium]|nr:ribonuclease [Actinomycetota bacterium]